MADSNTQSKSAAFSPETLRHIPGTPEFKKALNAGLDGGFTDIAPLHQGEPQTVTDFQPLEDEKQNNTQVTDFQPLPGVRSELPRDTEPQSFLDTANKFYASNPNDSTLAKIGKGFGRVAMAAPNLVNAIVSPPTEEEKKEGFAPWTMAGPLQVNRLLVDPGIKAEEHIDQLAKEQRIRDAAAGKPNRWQTRVAELAGKTMAVVPVVGPMALNMGEQAAKGDVAGTTTEALSFAAAPEILNEARAGGVLPGAPAAGARSFPTTDTAIRGAARFYNKAVEHAPVLGGLGGGVKGALEYGPGGGLGGAYIGERVGSKLQKYAPRANENFGLTREQANISDLRQNLTKAQRELSAVQKEAEKYSASFPPEDLQGRLREAQQGVAEAQFHYDAAVEASKPPQPEPQFHPEQVERYLRSRMVPAKEQAGLYDETAPAEPSAPANVKRPGDVAREIVNPSRVQRFENLPKPQTPSFKRILANEQGVVGENPALRGGSIAQKSLPPADTGTIEPQAPRFEILPPVSNADVNAIRKTIAPTTDSSGPAQTLDARDAAEEFKSKFPVSDTTDAAAVLADLPDQALIEFGERHGIKPDSSFWERDARRHRVGRKAFIDKVLKALPIPDHSALVDVANDFDAKDSELFSPQDRSNPGRAARARSVVGAFEHLKSSKSVPAGPRTRFKQ
jgi:hypothetical protein